MDWKQVVIIFFVFMFPLNVSMAVAVLKAFLLVRLWEDRDSRKNSPSKRRILEVVAH